MATIRNAGVYGDFIHNPLPDPHTEIRLIRVDLSDEPDSDIRCTISTHAIATPPPYIAISYTWGDITAKRSVFVNGKQVYIGHNSWLVLWQARLHSLAEPLWMDVLSIDQANDAEKSIQVGLMGTIYRNAQYVFISVGPHENNSEFLVKHIDAHARYIEAKRVAHSDARDPPLRPRGCSDCGQNSGSCNRCIACPARFCDTDSCLRSARNHKRNGHHIIVEQPTAKCVHCGQSYASRWYTCTPKTGDREFVLCRTCKEGGYHKDADTEVDFTLFDMWGDVEKPAGTTIPPLRRSLQLLKYFMDIPQPSHQLIVDALEAFSFRPYFSRLWIVQEYHLARRTIVACGNSTFSLQELQNLYTHANEELEGSEEGIAVKQRFNSITKRNGSRFLWTLFYWTGQTAMDLWGLLTVYSDFECSDPRDRVFGLLALADRALPTDFRPDYTMSAMHVFTQVLDLYAFNSEDSFPWCSGSETVTRNKVRVFDMYSLFGVLRGMRLHSKHPDVVAFLGSRASHKYLVDTRDVMNYQSTVRRVEIMVVSSCRISKNVTGELVVPCYGYNTDNAGRDFRYVQSNTEDVAISVKNPVGRDVALVDRRTKVGDTILFLHYERGRGHPSVAGLVVRPVQGSIHMIVGQAIFDSGVQPYDKNHCHCTTLGRLECDCKGDEYLHGSGKVQSGASWTLHMSVEDVFFFLVQDMGVQSTPVEKTLTVDIPLCWEHTARRLKTSITSKIFSSYVVQKYNL